MKVLSGMYGQRIVSDLGWTLPEVSEVPRFSSTSHTLLFSSPSTWSVVFQSRDTLLCLCSGPRCGFSLRIWYITEIAADAFCLLVCLFFLSETHYKERWLLALLFSYFPGTVSCLFDIAALFSKPKFPLLCNSVV